MRQVLPDGRPPWQYTGRARHVRCASLEYLQSGERLGNEGA